MQHGADARVTRRRFDNAAFRAYTNVSMTSQNNAYYSAVLCDDVVQSLGMYMYERVTCMTRLSPILTSKGWKHQSMLYIAREVEIRLKYR